MSGHTDKVGEPSTLPEPTREEKSAAWNWLKQYALSGIGDARQAYVALWEWTELKKASTASAARQTNATPQEPSGESPGTVGNDGYEQKASRGAPVRDVPAGVAPASSERATAGWQFVQDALRMEYERLDYPQRMFPQEAEAIGRSRDALLSAIATVQFAKETKQPLPKVAAASATRDSQLLDGLEKDVAEHGPLLLHDYAASSEILHRGLGLKCTGRSLRKALEDMLREAEQGAK